MDLRITYHVHGADERAAVARAREIALEQTVELAADALSADVVARIVGRIAAVEPLGEGRWSSVIAYDPAVVSGEMPQLLNLLFGNISLQSGVVVAGIEWPPELLASLGGPRHGIAGLRELTGAPGRAHRDPCCCGCNSQGQTEHYMRPAREAFGIGIQKDETQRRWR